MVKAEPEEQPEQEVELDPLPRIHTASTAALAAQKGTGPAVQYRTHTHTRPCTHLGCHSLMGARLGIRRLPSCLPGGLSCVCSG